MARFAYLENLGVVDVGQERRPMEVSPPFLVTLVVDRAAIAKMMFG